MNDANEITRLQTIEQAAKRLEEKLRQVFDSDEYHSVFMMAQIHGTEYSGPDCGEELTALSKALGREDSP